VSNSQNKFELIDFDIFVIENTRVKNQKNINSLDKLLRNCNILNCKSSMQSKNKIYSFALFSAIIAATIFRFAILQV